MQRLSFKLLLGICASALLFPDHRVQHWRAVSVSCPGMVKALLHVLLSFLVQTIAPARVLHSQLAVNVQREVGSMSRGPGETRIVQRTSRNMVSRFDRGRKHLFRTPINTSIRAEKASHLARYRIGTMLLSSPPGHQGSCHLAQMLAVCYRFEPSRRAQSQLPTGSEELTAKLKIGSDFPVISLQWYKYRLVLL